MSELKAMTIMTAYQLECNDDDLVYLKSDADKVIAELENKIKIYEDLGSCKKGCPALRHNQRRVESEIYKVGIKEKEIAKKNDEIRRQKYKRCLLYAKNHKNMGDLATDAVRLLGLNAYAFTKETETECIAYWNRISDCHYRHYNEWLKLAEHFKKGV